jgi:peptidoglycan/xylan/chitin deacetylase (PgdA/CDA1 family)
MRLDTCNMPLTIVTTSWDDGHHKDLRLAEHLAEYALKGTFYVALNHPGDKDIGDDEIRALQRMGMEIGSHTLTHRLLTGRSAEDVRYELAESKARLEDITGAPVVAFSYPEGAFTATACVALIQTGYSLGRTTMAFRTSTMFDPARMPISIDFRRASRVALARHALRDANIAGLADWLRLARLESDPVKLGKLLFDATHAHGGIFHINARSWEIDANGLWQDLDALLSHVAHRPGVHYATNSKALSLTQHEPQRGHAKAA